MEVVGKVVWWEDGMRGIATLAQVALAACVEPPPPTQAKVALEGACKSGNVSACQTIVEMQQRGRERRSAIPPPVMQTYYNNPADFKNPADVYTSIAPRGGTYVPVQPLSSGMKVCPNGQIVQQFYIC